jgi:RNA polymerase sigma-70 factor (ECF subfamily)
MNALKAMAQNDATTFEPQRSFLLGVALRMLGSVSEAEDVVQDTWLRWRTVDIASVNSPRAFLTQITTRLCLDRIKSAQHQREQYIGVRLPEPLEDALDRPCEAEPPAEAALEREQEVGLAFALMLQRLSPLERAVFLLHEVFEWGFDDIAQALGRSKAACWQLAARARAQVKLDAVRTPPRTVDPQHAQKQQALSAAFTTALRDGNVAELALTLASELA